MENDNEKNADNHLVNSYNILNRLLPNNMMREVKY